MSKKALEGIRVLDFTTMAAGPTAGAMMADYGAEVIKIERPVRGEDGRKFPPMVDGESLSHCWFNRGKKSLAVDLTDPEGLDIVYASLTTFGQTGKYVSKPGYDIIAQAMSGIMSVTGEADGAPQKSGFPLGDLLGGLNMFTGVMTALYHWRDTGEGQYVDISLLRTLIYINTPLIHCNLGPERMSKRQGNHHPTMCPYGVFHCKDGDIVMAAAGKRIWESLCDLMGRPEWKEDPEYAEVSDRARNQMTLIPLINKWLTDAYGGQDEALKALDAAGVPCCRVYNEYQVWSDEEFRLNGWLQEQPTMPGMDSKPSFITRTGNCGMSETPAEFRRAPLLGEQNEEILRELGYSSEKIAQLEQRWPHQSLDRHGKGGL